MAEVEVILKLERMGFFYDTSCVVIKEGNKIYCKAQNAFASCSAPEFGMGAYCPLYGFVFRIENDDIKEEEIKKYITRLIYGEDQEDPPPAGGAAMPSSPPEDEKSRWGGDAQPAA